VWLKDTGLAGADGAAITTWTNEAPSATAVFTQPVSGQRPVKKTAILNGHDVCRFDAGANTQLIAGDLSALFPTAATLFVVYSPTTATHGVYQASGAADVYWAFGGTGYMGAFRTARVDGYPAAMPTSGDHYVAVRSSAAAFQVWKDGVADSAQAAAYAPGTIHKVGTTAAALTGDVAEVLAYDSALSAGNMTSVHTYLATRFGL